jgi:hypothetical protein
MASYIGSIFAVIATDANGLWATGVFTNIAVAGTIFSTSRRNDWCRLYMPSTTRPDLLLLRRREYAPVAKYRPAQATPVVSPETGLVNLRSL